MKKFVVEIPACPDGEEHNLCRYRRHFRRSEGNWPAMDQAYEFLTEEAGLKPFEAYAYASARVSLRFGGPASPIVLAVGY